jgi:hypothetical protein
MKRFTPFFLTLAFFPAAAQTCHFEWAKQLTATLSTKAQSIAVDPGGNVYTAGYFSGSCDLDPGPGTYTLTAPGGSPATFV